MSALIGDKNLIFEIIFNPEDQKVIAFLAEFTQIAQNIKENKSNNTYLLKNKFINFFFSRYFAKANKLEKLFPKIIMDEYEFCVKKIALDHNIDLDAIFYSGKGQYFYILLEKFVEDNLQLLVDRRRSYWCLTELSTLGLDVAAPTLKSTNQMDEGVYADKAKT